MTTEVFNRAYKPVTSIDRRTDEAMYRLYDVTHGTMTAKKDFCNAQTDNSRFVSHGFLPIPQDDGVLEEIRVLRPQGQWHFLTNMERIPIQTDDGSGGQTAGWNFRWAETTPELLGTPFPVWGFVPTELTTLNNCRQDWPNAAAGGQDKNGCILATAVNPATPDYVVASAGISLADWQNGYGRASIDIGMFVAFGNGDPQTQSVNLGNLNANPPGFSAQLTVCQFYKSFSTPHERNCPSALKTYFIWSIADDRVNRLTSDRRCERLQFRGRRGATASVAGETDIELYDEPSDIAWRGIDVGTLGNAGDRNFWIANEGELSDAERSYHTVIDGAANFGPRGFGLAERSELRVTMCEFCSDPQERVTLQVHELEVTNTDFAGNSAKTCAREKVGDRIGAVMSIPQGDDDEIQRFLRELNSLTDENGNSLIGSFLLDAAHYDGEWQWFKNNQSLNLGSVIRTDGAVPPGTVSKANACLVLYRRVSNDDWQVRTEQNCNNALPGGTGTRVICEYEPRTDTMSDTNTISISGTASGSMSQSQSLHSTTTTHSVSETLSITQTSSSSLLFVSPPAGQVSSFSGGELVPELRVDDFRSNVANAVGSLYSEVNVASVRVNVNQTRQAINQTESVCVWFSGDNRSTYAARFGQLIGSADTAADLGFARNPSRFENPSNASTAKLCPRVVPPVNPTGVPTVAPTAAPVVSHGDNNDISLGAFLGTIIPLGVGVLAVCAIIGAILRNSQGTGQRAEQKSRDIQQQGDFGASASQMTQATATTRAVSNANAGNSNVVVIRAGPPTNTQLVAPAGVPPPPEDGDWVWDNDSRLYWSDKEYLYYDPNTTHSYDPNSGRWYHPSTGQWELAN